MQGMMAAESGQTSTLAQDPDFALAARALSGLQVTAGAISDYPMTPDDLVASLKRLNEGFDNEALKKSLTASPLLAPFPIVAGGLGQDGQGWFVAVVIVNKDAQSAQTNEARLEARLRNGGYVTSENPTVVPWSNAFGSAAIGVSGKLVMAKLYGRSHIYPLPYALFYSQPLFLGAPLAVHR